MISISFLVLLHLIVFVSGQQYRCSIRYSTPDSSSQDRRHSTSLTLTEKCPTLNECANNNSYVFLRHDHYVKKDRQIGVSFSWKPNLNFSSPLCGFKITLRERRSSSISTQYYCPNKTIDFNHTNFYFECNKTAKPRMQFKVTISPISTVSDVEYLNSVNKTFKLPSCRSKRIASSKFCPSTKLIVPKTVDCRNRSFEVDYDIVPLSKRRATGVLRVCKKDPPDSLLCRDIDEIPVVKNLSLSGRRNITIPKNVFYNVTYFVEVYPFLGKGHNEMRVPENITHLFHACISTLEAKTDHKFPVFYIVLISVIAVSVCVVIIVGYKTRCSLHAVPMLTKSESPDPIEPETLYLVFVDDHPKHRDVVLKLASHLKFKMGFQVLFELYQKEEVHKGPSAWMKKSLAGCDKVLFVWSPGASNRWRLQNDQKLSDDMYTPVLAKAAKDLLKNPHRYHFVSFDYCVSDDVPDEFRNRRCNFYNLMEDYDEFYCKLKNLDLSRCYRHCCNEIFLELVGSESGSVLLDAVSDMQKYVQDNPAWHKEGNSPKTLYEKQQPTSESNVNPNKELLIVPPSPIGQNDFLSYRFQNGGETDIDAKTQFKYSELPVTSYSPSVHGTADTRNTRIPVEQAVEELDTNELELEVVSEFNTSQSSSYSTDSTDISKISGQRTIFAPVPVEMYTDPMTSLMALNNMSYTSTL